MKKKQREEDKQLSLMLEEFSSYTPSTALSFETGQRPPATVIQFPTSKDKSFRERVIQDLVTSRVMVAD